MFSLKVGKGPAEVPVFEVFSFLVGAATLPLQVAEIDFAAFKNLVAFLPSPGAEVVFLAKQEDVFVEKH